MLTLIISPGKAILAGRQLSGQRAGPQSRFQYLYNAHLDLDLDMKMFAER